MSVVQLMQLDVPNRNGRIYSTEVISETLDKLPSTVFGTLGMTVGPVPIDQIAFIASDFKIDGEFLTAKISPSNSPMGYVLQENLAQDIRERKTSIAFRTSGTGDITAGDPNVTNFRITSIAAIPVEQAA